MYPDSDKRPCLSRNHELTVNSMWIEMKTYSIQNGEDIDTILLNNMNKLYNIFELCAKDIQRPIKKTIHGMDLILFSAILTPLQIQKINSSKSLLKKNSEMCILDCTNIKNQNGEYFSSIIDNLDENDRIIISNGVVLRQFTLANPKLLTVLVRPQDNPSVILFKYKNSLEKSLLAKNLSLITGSGVYWIFGNIKEIVRYNKELMALRLQSFDETKLKTLKYYFFFRLFKNVANNPTKSLVKYDIFSNEVDILVITPSNDFTSLSPNQQICLNNLEVKNIDDSDIFLLFINGSNLNLKVVPKENDTVNIFSPPTRPIPTPIELKAEIYYRYFKKLTIDVQLVVDKSIEQLNTKERKIYTQSQISRGTYSFSFSKTKSNIFLFNFADHARRYKGNCKLISIEPNIFYKNEIVSGYCIKCSAFIQKRFLNCTTQSSEYTCPKCFSIVHLTFFFKMYFACGKNNPKALQVHCYGQRAESVITYILGTKIELEDYLSEPYINKLVKNILSKVICNEIKFNIVTTFIGKKHILLDILQTE